MSEWPKHPDGSPKTFGEMTPQERREATTRAVAQLKTELESPQMRAAIAEIMAPANNKERFAEAYRAGLRAALDQRPDDYPPMTTPEQRDAYVAMVAPRMFDAIERNSFNHDSRGFRNACKSLGIKPTRTAILAYWNSHD